MFKKLLSLVRNDQPSFTRQESLHGVVMVAEGIDSEPSSDGERVLLLPRRPLFSGVLSRWVEEDPKPIRLILDELGNTVFEAIDGRRTVGDIIAFFAKKRNVHKREAEAGLVAFLNQLMQRNIIVVRMSQKKAG
ncbi:MAG: PqqD family protein [Planctomycetota bacterium]|jgi:hypothetical protein